MFRMAGVTHSHCCFSGEAGVVHILQGGECGTGDLSCCAYYALQGFPVVVSAAPTPHSDATGEDAVNVAPVERVHDCLPEFLEEVSEGAAVPFLPVMQCWWSRRGPH